MPFVSDIKQIKELKLIKKMVLVLILNIKRSIIPAVTHVDYSSRIQTVEKKINLKFYKLIEAFYKITGCPILINTSFNVRGEPIVNSPLDAIKCFFNTNMDLLIIENFVIDKNNQNVIILKNMRLNSKLIKLFKLNIFLFLNNFFNCAFLHLFYLFCYSKNVYYFPKLITQI